MTCSRRAALPHPPTCPVSRARWCRYGVQCMRNWSIPVFLVCSLIVVAVVYLIVRAWRTRARQMVALRHKEGLTEQLLDKSRREVRTTPAQGTSVHSIHAEGASAKSFPLRVQLPKSFPLGVHRQFHSRLGCSCKSHSATVLARSLLSQ